MNKRIKKKTLKHVDTLLLHRNGMTRNFIFPYFLDGNKESMTITDPKGVLINRKKANALILGTPGQGKSFRIGSVER